MANFSTGVFSSFVTINVANRFDTNRDGLDKREVARAAVETPASGDVTDQKLRVLLATTVVGGRNGYGYFEDIDQDRNGRLSTDELNRFASLDGNGDTFSSTDFQRLAPNKFLEGGRELDEERLRAIAEGRPVYTPPATQPPSYNPPPTTPPGYNPTTQPGGLDSSQLLVSFLRLFLQLFTQLLGGQQGASTGTSTIAAAR
jgi:hypothetical protein